MERDRYLRADVGGRHRDQRHHPAPTTVAIAAVYFLIVKPVSTTTESISHGVERPHQAPLRLNWNDQPVIVRSLMRLVVTVAILAAVYFLIVKPVLDTTESITHDVTHSVSHGLHSAQKSFDNATGQNDSRKHKK